MHPRKRPVPWIRFLQNLFFDCLDIFLPVIAKIINYSLEHGVFPTVWKNALVFSLLEEDGLEPILKKLSTCE